MKFVSLAFDFVTLDPLLNTESTLLVDIELYLFGFQLQLHRTNKYITLFHQPKPHTHRINHNLIQTAYHPTQSFIIGKIRLQIIVMSIFSGFATRKQQEKYDHCVVATISLLQDKILQLMSYCNLSQPQFLAFKFQFKDSLKRLAGHLKQMQKSKYLPPKISPILHSLLEKFDINITAERCNTQQRTIPSKFNQPSLKSSNVRITTRASTGVSRTVSKDKASRKKIYDKLKENSPQEEVQVPATLDLDNMDMEELLKMRPALPKRISIIGPRRKKINFTNLYQINEFEDEQGFQSQPLKIQKTSYSNMPTPHSNNFSCSQIEQRHPDH